MYESGQELNATPFSARKDILAHHRAFRVKPNDYATNLMEWIACLELVIDMKSLHPNTGVARQRGQPDKPLS
jgi:hypothetical protein